VLRSTPLIVVAGKAGRLANRLLLFGNLIGWSLEHGFTVSNPSLDEFSPYFRLASKDLLLRVPLQRSFVPPNPLFRRLAYELARFIASLLWSLNLHSTRGILVLRLPSVYEGMNLRDPELIDRVGRHRYSLLQGWLFRDVTSLAKHRDAICATLRPIETIEQRASRAVASVREHCRVLIGVHIRRGDYALHLDGRFHYSFDDYRHVMKQVAQLFGDSVGFLICSDEDRLPSMDVGHPLAFGEGHEAVDLFSLAQCDYLVGPPSSYTLWASFYGETPLFQITKPGVGPQSLEEFVVAPEILDPEIRRLY
jgi:hypothetical protein